jgi:hypothetical protein
MKTLLFLLTLSTSTCAFADAGLVTLDAYKICPNLKSYTYGYNITSYEVDTCIDEIEGNKFQKEAALICLNLPHYSYGYWVSGDDVTSCLQHITNKTYSDNRIKYCKNLKILNLQNGYYTMASDVYNCLK